MVIHVITLYLNKIEWWNMKKLHTLRSINRRIQEWYTTEQLSSRANVVVRTVHTDVVVIALGYFHQLEDKRIWVESKNSLRYIIIKQLFDQLGELLFKALSFYHAFTGCDYTSSFNRKGFQETFLNLLHSEDIPDDMKSIIKSFVCQLFGRKTTNSVDQASLEIFIAK